MNKGNRRPEAADRKKEKGGIKHNGEK